MRNPLQRIRDRRVELRELIAFYREQIAEREAVLVLLKAATDDIRRGTE